MLSQLNNNQRMLLLSLIFLPAIAWLGPLDKLSYTYVDDTLTNAGLIYATARGINAVISVIQTTEVDAALVSVQVGQVLDPVNDLIERFSGIMLVSLGSLALQRIILEVVSDFTFNVILTVLAVLSVGTLVMGYQKYYGYFARGFFVTAFLRFALLLVLLANSWIDSTFLLEAENERHDQMKSFQSDIEAARTGAYVDEKVLDELRTESRKLEGLESQLQSLATEYEPLNAELADIESQLDSARQESTSCRLFISSRTCSAEVLGIKSQLDQAKDIADEKADQIALIEDQIEDKNEALTCLDKRSKGEACGLIDSVKNTLSLENKLKALEGGMAMFVDSTVSLLMSFLLKTIIIPLVFLYCLIRSMGIAWTKISRQFKATDRYSSV